LIGVGLTRGIYGFEKQTQRTAISDVKNLLLDLAGGPEVERMQVDERDEIDNTKQKYEGGIHV